jgi:hypothetical protein
MKRILVGVVILLGLVPAAGAGPDVTGGAMLMGQARVDASGQVLLRVPFGARPAVIEVEVPRGGKTEKAFVRRSFSSELGLDIDAKYVEAVDADGRTIPASTLAKLLEKERPVVIFDGGRRPTAPELKLFKAGTVVLIVPVAVSGDFKIS